ANLEYQALALQTDEAGPPGSDTVKKLTDTSRERIKQQRQKTKTSIEGPKSTTRIKPFRRRRRWGARLAALSLLIAFVGGIISVIVFVLPKPSPTKIVSAGTNSASSTSEENKVIS